MPFQNTTTPYGYHVRATGPLPRDDAGAWSADLRRLVRARDAGDGFGLLVDVRGQLPYGPEVAEHIRETMTWLRDRGLVRSAVVTDDPAILLLTRQSARRSGVYEYERYFNALHDPHWHAHALGWVVDGVDVTLARPDEARAEMLLVLDALSEGVALFDAHGALVRVNPVLARFLGDAAGDAAGEHPVLEGARRAARTLARSVAAAARDGHPPPAAPKPRVVTVADGGRVQLRANVVGPGVFAPGATILVAVGVAAPHPLDDAELRATHRLTPREVEAVRLAARGLTNEEVAAAMGLRHATARNHIWMAMQKLGVSNRTSLAAVLAGRPAGDRG